MLFDPEDFRAEQNYRSECLNTLKTHSWYKPVIRTLLLSTGTFNLKEGNNSALQTDRARKTLIRLGHVATIDEYTLLQVVTKLKKMVENRDAGMMWWHAAILLTQLSVGSRFIEVLCASKFLQSTQKKFDSELYLIIQGVAKASAKAVRKFDRDFKEAQANPEAKEVLEKLVNSTEQELLENEPEKIIVKPVLFGDSHGITPRYIIQLVKDIRDKITLPCSNSVEDRKELSSKYTYNI